MRAELRSLVFWLTFVGVIVAIITLAAQLTQDDSDEARRSDCREDHDAPIAPERSAFSLGTWGDCSWPPPEGAAKDGYGEITLSRVETGVDANVSYKAADIFDTRCKRLELQYRHDQQGNQIVSKRAIFDTGQVLGLTISPSNDIRLRATSLPAFVNVGANEVVDGKLVVIVPIAVQVQRVVCA